MKRFLAVSAALLLLCSCGQGDRTKVSYPDSDNTHTESCENSEDTHVFPESGSETLSEVSSETDAEKEEDMRWKLFDEIYPKLDANDGKLLNYAHNSQIKIEGFIKNGQANPPVSDLMLGKSRFADVGCEVIAAYNYLLYMGKDPDLAKLTLDFEKNALLSSDGSLGSNPRKISGLFKAMEIDFEKLYKADDVQTALAEGKPVIFAFHIGDNVFSGIHTVFAVREDGVNYVYNRYNSSKDAEEFSGIEDIIKKKSLFIIGYTEK